MGYIDTHQVIRLAEALAGSDVGKYLLELVNDRRSS
jgi:dTDP-glucose pyrophosphorylase